MASPFTPAIIPSAGLGSVIVSSTDTPSAGEVLTATSATAADWEAAGVGGALAYVEITASAAITATTEAGADTVATAGAITFSGSQVVLLEFFCPTWICTASGNIFVTFFDGSTSLAKGAFQGTGIASCVLGSVYAARRLTPSAAAHTYSVRSYCGAGTSGTLFAGAGGAGNYVPGYFRITQVA